MSFRRETSLVVTVAMETKASRSSPRGWAEASTVELRFKRHGRALTFTCGGKNYLLDRDAIEAIYDLANEEA